MRVITKMKPDSLSKHYHLGGPMSPMLSMRVVAREMGVSPSGLIRLDFRDIHGDYIQGMYNVLEPGEGFTGYGAFIMVSRECSVLYIDCSDEIKFLAMNLGGEISIKAEFLAVWHNYLLEEGIKQLLIDAEPMCKDNREELERLMATNLN